MKKDLKDYVTVKERKQIFYNEHSDGRIVVEAIKADIDSALFKATIYCNQENQKENLPKATGFAQEFRGKNGFANNTSWTENCEESAIGRALDNAGYSVNNKCSKEEIVQAERNKEALKVNNNNFDKEIKKRISEHWLLLDEEQQNDVKSKYKSVKEMNRSERNEFLDYLWSITKNKNLEEEEEKNEK